MATMQYVPQLLLLRADSHYKEELSLSTKLAL